MKDRLARTLIERAAAKGLLPPGGTVVEYTAGTTGISLAFVARALGYKTHFAFSDAFSDEKRWTMRAFGAEITDVPSDNKMITKELIHAMIAKAGEISKQPGHWWADQLQNEDGAAGYHGLGDEIWRQTHGKIDEVLTVSTADAKAMARRLAKEEAIFAGTSTGANIVAALRIAGRLGSAATVATLVVDSGLRYLSTNVFRGA